MQEEKAKQRSAKLYAFSSQRVSIHKTLQTMVGAKSNSAESEAPRLRRIDLSELMRLGDPIRCRITGKGRKRVAWLKLA